MMLDGWCKLDGWIHADLMFHVGMIDPSWGLELARQRSHFLEEQCQSLEVCNVTEKPLENKRVEIRRLRNGSRTKKNNPTWVVVSMDFFFVTPTWEDDPNLLMGWNHQLATYCQRNRNMRFQAVVATSMCRTHGGHRTKLIISRCDPQRTCCFLLEAFRRCFWQDIGDGSHIQRLYIHTVDGRNLAPVE